MACAISTELMGKGVVVDIYDNLMFCDEFAENNEVKVCDVFKRKIDCKNYDKVVWCMDIDVLEFYTLTESDKYIKKNIKKFKELSEKLGDKLVWVTDFFNVEIRTPYDEMLDKKFTIANTNKSRVISVPSLYGPSPRMRFDTIVNEMIITAIIESMIYVDGWMDTVNLQSVAVVGKTIAKSIHTDSVIDCPILRLTKLEVANIVKKSVSEKVVILLSEEYTSIDSERLSLSEYDKKAEFSIENSIKYMLAGMENGVVDSIVKDMYNNSRIVSNYISTKGIHSLLEDLTR